MSIAEKDLLGGGIALTVDGVTQRKAILGIPEGNIAVGSRVRVINFDTLPQYTNEVGTVVDHKYEYKYATALDDMNMDGAKSKKKGDVWDGGKGGNGAYRVDSESESSDFSDDTISDVSLTSSDSDDYDKRDEDDYFENIGGNRGNRARFGTGDNDVLEEPNAEILEDAHEMVPFGGLSKEYDASYSLRQMAFRPHLELLCSPNVKVAGAIGAGMVSLKKNANGTASGAMKVGECDTCQWLLGGATTRDATYSFYFEAVNNAGGQGIFNG